MVIPMPWSVPRGRKEGTHHTYKRAVLTIKAEAKAKGLTDHNTADSQMAEYIEGRFSVGRKTQKTFIILPFEVGL